MKNTTKKALAQAIIHFPGFGSTVCILDSDELDIAIENDPWATFSFLFVSLPSTLFLLFFFYCSICFSFSFSFSLPINLCINTKLLSLFTQLKLLLFSFFLHFQFSVLLSNFLKHFIFLFQTCQRMVLVLSIISIHQQKKIN